MKDLHKFWKVYFFPDFHTNLIGLFNFLTFFTFIFECLLKIGCAIKIPAMTKKTSENMCNRRKHHKKRTVYKQKSTSSECVFWCTMRVYLTNESWLKHGKFGTLFVRCAGSFQNGIIFHMFIINNLQSAKFRFGKATGKGTCLFVYVFN